MTGTGKVRNHKFDVWSINHNVETETQYLAGRAVGHSIGGHWATITGPGRFPIQEFYDPVENKPRKRRIRVEFDDVITILEDAEVDTFEFDEREGYRVKVAIKGQPVMKNP